MNDAAGESRPKIHRMPQQPADDSEQNVSRAVVIVCLVVLLVIIIPALLSFNKVDRHNVAESIPAEQSNIISQTPDADHTTVAVHDEKGEMVGQLAKMPADVERGATINSMSKVDSASGKELMNIISKD